MSVKITDFNFLCNLGNDKESAFQKALLGVNDCFTVKDDLIKGKAVRHGLVDFEGNEIKNPDYNLRCNELILECLKKLKIKELIEKYGTENIGLIVATTNSGTMEYSKNQNPKHAELSNPAEFVKEYLGLKNFYTTVSTACSSGIKAFSIARKLMNSGIIEAAIVIGVDSVSSIPIYGFDSLEILSAKASNPFGLNRLGINIGEGAAAFILEKEGEGIEIKGIGETTDFYHPTAPDPNAKEAIRAIETALEEANLTPENIDYINLHGTGTPANDLMEANAIYKIFKDKTPASSAKPLTGHCLGAASSIETALCCMLLKEGKGKLLPHIYNNEYDPNIPKIRLVQKNETKDKIKNVLCTSFGFGGANAVIVLGGKE